MFLLGTAEVFADNTASTLLPMLVARDDLAIANSRLQTGFLTINQLAAPPIGALLFTAGHFIPFATQALIGVLAVVLIARLQLPAHGRNPEEARPVWHDIVEGFRWTWHHAAVRTLVLTILIFNVTFGAAWSVLVLYATEHLGLGSVGFGLVTTVMRGRRPDRHPGVRLADPPDQPRKPHADRVDHRDPHPSRAGLHLLAVRRDAGLLHVRRARVRVGHHLDHDPAACGADRAPGPGRVGEPGRHLRRARGRSRDRRGDRAALGRDGAVLVRLRGVGGVRRAHLAPAQPHRA